MVHHRRFFHHFAVALAVVAVVAACSSGGGNVQPKAPSSTPAPGRATGPALRAATPGGTDVRASGARGDGTGDDTAAFVHAQDAALASGVRAGDGPSGRPQAVVYVPPGTYRLLRLAFRSDVRMEVDAGAVLEQAGGRNIDVKDNVPALIVWDGPPGQALQNVSLVGVNTSSGGRKTLAEPLFPGWSVEPDFTFDLDPATTDANEAVAGLQAVNVDGFSIENVYSIQNDSPPATKQTNKAGWWPGSQKAALGLRGSSATPTDGSVYYDPHNGTVTNWYNVNSPKGYGPNQVNAGHNLSFHHIYTRGGTALRLETDASQGKGFGSELRGVQADDIAGQNCNRAVAFAPHAQTNHDVHVTHVQASGCAQGVLESRDETNKSGEGSFQATTIADVTVTGGDRAQDSRQGTHGLWTVAESEMAFAKDSKTRSSWSVVYTSGTFHCTGAFKRNSDQIMTTDGLQRPKCD
jgi:hypothetical protein